MTDHKHADKAVYSVLIDAPIETVWSELVNTTSPRQFFFNARCDTPGLRPGAPYRMVARDGKHVAVVGEVLEFDPPHRYSHTFRFTNLDDPPCKVTYELSETPKGVEFRLITEQVPAGTKTEKSMAQGGVFITNNLKALIETGKPTFSGRLILGIIALTAPFAPKSMRIEHWPLASTD